MEDTYRIKAIVLNRERYRENDLTVTVYSRDYGKLQLIARGAKKFRSKIAAHIEPFCLIEGMVVRGKHRDYLGSAISSRCFIHLKADLDKIKLASEAAAAIRIMTKDNLPDDQIFDLLLSYLILLDNPRKKAKLWLKDAFEFKMLSALGFGSDLSDCGVCKKPLIAGNSILAANMGQVCHPSCLVQDGLTISDNCIKLLRIVIFEPFVKIQKLALSAELSDEFKNVIRIMMRENF
jgi:DNA repair protein RecO (recombination protein O)